MRKNASKLIPLLLGLLLLLSACSTSQKPTLPDIISKDPNGQTALVSTEAGTDTGTEKAGTESVSEPSGLTSGRQRTAAGKLSDGTDFVLYTDGGLELSGGKLTARLSSDQMLTAHLDKITAVVFGPGMTGAGKLSCEGLTKVKQVTFPETPFEIESNAFSGCTALMEINWGGTTVIGDNAFSGCSALQSVRIPAGATAMGTGVFASCGALTSVTFEGSVLPGAFRNNTTITQAIFTEGTAGVGAEAFSGCTALNTVAFTPSVNRIDDSAFSGCSALTTLNLPEGLTEIGDHAFQNCTGIQELKFPASVTKLGAYAFSGCTGVQDLQFPATLKEVGAYAFSGCTHLQGITLNEGLDSLGDGTFANCTELKNVAILGKDIRMGKNVFSGCSAINRLELNLVSIPENGFSFLTSLREVQFDENVEEIGAYAFDGCTGLGRIEIPDTVRSIGAYAFQNCSGVTGTVRLGNPALIMGENAFKGCTQIQGLDLQLAAVPNYGFSSLTALREVTLGANVTEIGSYAFDGCTGLTRIEIPDTMRKIGSYAFRNCSGLSGTVRLGNKELELGESAFYGCSQISGLVLKLKTIPKNAFAEMKGLKEIDFDREDPSTEVIGEHAFENCESLQEVYLTEGIRVIGEYAFANCKNMRRIVLPTTLETAGQRLFDGCSRETLEWIYYRGRSFEFNKVNRGMRKPDEWLAGSGRTKAQWEQKGAQFNCNDAKWDNQK